MRKTVLKRRGFIAPVSAKRQVLMTQRRKVMESEFGPRSEWRCLLVGWDEALKVMGPCFGPVNGHEIVRRSQGGSIVDIANIVLLCNAHNERASMDFLTARKLGLVRYAWEVK